MLTMLKNWPGTVEVNGVEYKSMSDVFTTLNKPLEGNIHIILKPIQVNTKNEPDTKAQESKEYRITVKKYMTQKSEPGFDFMEKWNNDNPMPLRTMIGTVVKETRGMVRMKLHGDIYAEKICSCMKCGRTITNPVSQYFGMGPECGGHGYINPFNSEQELREAVGAYRKQLQNITWEGWVIKSSLLKFEEITL